MPPLSWTILPVAYVDGMTVAQPVSVPQFTQPFDGVAEDYVLTQDFMQLLANYTDLALNTPHPDYPTFYLVKEGPKQPQGGGVVKWTRTYAQVPATRYDYSTYAYNLIGFQATGTYTSVDAAILALLTLGRRRVVKSLPCTIQYDYFAVDPTATIPGSYTDPSLIPVIQEFKYYQPLGEITYSGGWIFTPAYGNPTLAALYGLPVDYLNDGSGFLGSPNQQYQGMVLGTVPTRTAYMAMVTANTPIAAEPSALARWMGNIYVRTIKYVIAA